MRTVGRALAAVAVGLVVLTGCGSSGRPVTAHVAPASAATIRTARCIQWHHMTADQRTALIAGMRKFFGGMVDQPGMRGQVVPALTAYKVIDGYCRLPFATYFRLYRIYGDEAAFSPAAGR
jgi:hypothetical protein